MLVYISGLTEMPKNLLGHILKHYTALGVERFAYLVYGGESSPAWTELKEASKSYNIDLHACDKPWSVSNDSDFKNEIRMTLNPTDWIIPADLDEFHIHPQFNSFIELGKAMDAEGAELVKTSLVDRITTDGSIPLEILPDAPLTEQFPVTKLVSAKIMKCYVWKMMMMKPTVNIWPGHHIIGVHNIHKHFSSHGQILHFKWFGNVHEKEKKKMALYKSFYLPWWREQARLFIHLRNNGGKL